MTTAAPEVETSTTAQAQKPADVFVVFGITGDLAKVMTFHSLYRLEQRGLIDCPIVGVAVDDWTVDQLKDRARVLSWSSVQSSTATPTIGQSRSPRASSR